MTPMSDEEVSDDSSDHEQSDKDEEIMFRKLEAELDSLAWDSNLIQDLKKLKRSTENKEVQVDDGLMPFDKNAKNDSMQSDASLQNRLISEEAERAAKSIGGTITNAQLQNYY